MTAKYLSAVLTFWLGLSSGFSFEIYHTPPQHFLQGVPGQLEVILPYYLDTPDFVRLYIREQEKDVYQELIFEQDGGTWYCNIPAAFMMGDTLCYYIGASFGPAGLAAFPPSHPEENPVKIPLVQLQTTHRKIEPEFTKDVIVTHTVTPWKPRPARRSNNFPVLYIPKPNNAFVESGFIKIVGNEKASVEDLLRSMLYLCLQENADAITSVKYALLTAAEGKSKITGHIEMEGVYLRRLPRK